MENYEAFSYADLADLQGAFDALAGVARSVRDNGGKDTREFSDLMGALFTAGNMISYGEETYAELAEGVA